MNEVMEKYEQCPAFDDLRQIIEHEDGLIDKRIGWMLAFNGLLFAAWGLSLSAKVSLAASCGEEPCTGVKVALVQELASQINALQIAMVLAGVLSTIAALVGISAAGRAIHFAKYDLLANVLKWNEDRAEGRLIPIAGNERTARFGIAYALSVPVIVAMPWLYLFQSRDVGTEPGAWLVQLIFTVVPPVCFWGIAISYVTASLTGSGQNALERHNKMRC